jgi:hypothetical protein
MNDFYVFMRFHSRPVLSIGSLRPWTGDQLSESRSLVAHFPMILIVGRRSLSGNESD